MNKNIIIGAVIAVAVVLMAVAGFKAYQVDSVKSAKDNMPPKACTEEAKICPDGSAVGRTEPNCEFAACPSEDSGAGGEAIASLSEDEALAIAREAEDCSMAGVLTDKIFYNGNSQTWWIDLERMPELEKDGCNPACVVFEDTKTTEVNWRCTGLIMPEESAE
ncbi:MAG: hypothetical protein Q8O59_00475 [bacterium]|nr:hypothetical protein [bacterium]